MSAGELAPAGGTPHPDAWLSPRAIERLEDAVPANTRHAYGRQMADYRAWCAAVGRTAVPAAAETIIEYLAYLADAGSSVSNLRQAHAAIRVLHRDNGCLPPDTRGASMITRGHARDLADDLVTIRKAQVFDADDITAMAGACDRSTLTGRRDRLVLTLGVKTCGRRSELTGYNRADLVRYGDDRMTARVRRSKTDQAALGREVAIIGAGDKPTCALSALREWDEALAALDPPIVGGTLLRRVGANRDPYDTNQLDSAVVDQIVRRLAKKAGLDKKYAETGAPISAHSLRASGATIMLNSGSPLTAVAEIGGWSPTSRELVAYWRLANRWKNHPMSETGI